jgi:glucose/arabinose dehydrogenase
VLRRLGPFAAVVLIAGCLGSPPAPTGGWTLVTPAVPSASPLPTRTPSPTPSSRPTPTVGPSASPTPTPVATPDPATVAIRLDRLEGSFDKPVYITSAGDRSDRLYVVGQSGVIKVRGPDGVVSTFLDLHVPVLCCGERGLLGLAFHPDYARSFDPGLGEGKPWGYGRFYVFYTRGDQDLVIAEYRRSAGDPLLADPASRRDLVLIEHSRFPHHNGGSLQFGEDGYLYIGTGDGGGVGNPLETAQRLDSLLGKILRIDVRPETTSDTGDERPYRIPGDNPFADDPEARPEIWAYGLRNPWRFSFDRGTRFAAGTGDLWIGDVGQARREEIDRAPADEDGRNAGRGLNFGWDEYEGDLTFECPCRSAGKTAPRLVYGHGAGDLSVVGGYVYRGAQAALGGWYLYADSISGRIWGLAPNGGKYLLLDSPYFISSFGLDSRGELLVTDLVGGRIYRVTATTR